MREILLRGKRIDNGEWVEGVFLNDRDSAFYICPSVSDISYGDGGNRRRIGCWYKVDPSTVGQYTGLKDKNGKRIFEGDILGSRYDDLYPDDVAIEVVKWFRNGWYIQQCEYLQDAMDGDGVMPYSEVIGNITDNPELLEK